MTTPRITLNWGNTHADHCEVAKGRKALEDQLNEHLRNWPRWREDTSKGQRRRADLEWMHRLNYLWGAIIEYDKGGDEDADVCECGQAERNLWRWVRA